MSSTSVFAASGTGAGGFGAVDAGAGAAGGDAESVFAGAGSPGGTLFCLLNVWGKGSDR